MRKIFLNSMFVVAAVAMVSCSTKQTTKQNVEEVVVLFFECSAVIKLVCVIIEQIFWIIILVPIFLPLVITEIFK